MSFHGSRVSLPQLHSEPLHCEPSWLQFEPSTAANVNTPDAVWARLGADEVPDLAFHSLRIRIRLTKIMRILIRNISVLCVGKPMDEGTKG